MATLLDKLNNVYSSGNLENLKKEIMIELSRLQLANDYLGMEKFYSSYIRMIDRITGLSEMQATRRAQSELEYLSHVADLYPIHGDEAFTQAKSDPPGEGNLMAVRKFYRNAVHGSNTNA